MPGAAGPHPGDKADEAKRGGKAKNAKEAHDANSSGDEADGGEETGEMLISNAGERFSRVFP